jgi:hypothetical protein
MKSESGMKRESGIQNPGSGGGLPPPASPRGGGEAPLRKILRSEELFGEAREIVIRHNGQEYRMQVTRNGKLILTK